MAKMQEGQLKDAAAILTDSRKLESMTLQLQAELDGFENGMKAVGDLPDKGKGVMSLINQVEIDPNEVPFEARIKWLRKVRTNINRLVGELNKARAAAEAGPKKGGKR